MEYVKHLMKFIATASILFISLASCSNNSDDSSANKDSQSCLEESDLNRFELTDESKELARGETIDLVVYDAFLAPEGAFERF